MMTSSKDYDSILQEYPEYISKEQMYKLCSISKKRCLWLLESGLVPCIDTGKPTHRFKIATVDVVFYLKNRERNPNDYKSFVHLSESRPRKNPRTNYCPTVNPKLIAMMRSYFEYKLQGYSDVLSITEVSEFTGYSKSAATAWCRRGFLRSFFIHEKYCVPKEYLLEFLVSEHFIWITVKSKQHISFYEEIMEREHSPE